MKRPVETLEDLMALEQMDDVEDESSEAYGVSYAADEELWLMEKELERDRHRWELDPASSEDYIDRLHPAGLAWKWRHF